MNTMWFSSPVETEFPTDLYTKADLPKNLLSSSMNDYDLRNTTQSSYNPEHIQTPHRPSRQKHVRVESFGKPKATSSSPKTDFKSKLINRSNFKEEILYSPFCDDTKDNHNNHTKSSNNKQSVSPRPTPTRNRRLNISEQYYQIINNTSINFDNSPGKQFLNESDEYRISTPPKYSRRPQKGRDASIYAIEHTSPTNLLKKNMSKPSTDSPSSLTSTSLRPSAKTNLKPQLRRSKGVNCGLDILAKQEIRNPPSLTFEYPQTPLKVSNSQKYLYIEIEDDLSTLNIPSGDDERILQEVNTRPKYRCSPPKLAVHSQQLSPGRRNLQRKSSMNTLEEIAEEEEEWELSENQIHSLNENSDDMSNVHYYDIDLLVSYLDITDNDGEENVGHANYYKRAPNRTMALDKKSLSNSDLYRSNSSGSTVSLRSSVGSMNSVISTSSSISSISSVRSNSPNSLSSFLYGSYFDIEKKMAGVRDIDTCLAAN